MKWSERLPSLMWVGLIKPLKAKESRNPDLLWVRIIPPDGLQTANGGPFSSRGTHTEARSFLALSCWSSDWKYIIISPACQLTLQTLGLLLTSQSYEPVPCYKSLSLYTSYRFCFPRTLTITSLASEILPISPFCRWNVRSELATTSSSLNLSLH